ncbi:MAG TPA: hypothetical protein VI007_04990 [bacterium]
MRTAVALLAAVMLTAGCRAAPSTPSFTEHRDQRTGFAVRLPGGWVQAALPPGGPEVRFVPRGAEPQSPEFISVFTVPSSGPPAEAEIRRQVFTLLPIQGVSGFLQDPRTTAAALWYRFELTGSSGSTEWALVGAAAAGRARIQIVVCAKPLAQWRQGQRQCDEVVRSFAPGDLTEN